MTLEPATVATSSGRRGYSRFRLRWLLLLFIPFAIGLTIYSRKLMQLQRVHAALERVNTVGFDANLGDKVCILKSKKGNLTDGDLRALIPLGAGEATMANRKIIRIELRGSKVSDEAIAEFGRSAPECELVR